MANTKPAEIQVLDEIEARAGNISVSYGYFSSVAKIERAKLTPFQGADWPQLSFWLLNESTNRPQYGGNENSLTLVVAYMDETRDRPYVDLAAELRADVILALNRTTVAPAVSDDPSHDLGDMVKALNFVDSEYVIGEGESPWCGIIITFNVEFLTPLNDPLTIDI